MSLHPLAGRPAPQDLLENIPRLVTAYFAQQPDPNVPAQRVAFGTSGHRGCALDSSFNEAHVLAIAQAICEWRQAEGVTGPLHLGIDTHALSEPALATTVEVLSAHDVPTVLESGLGYTATPVISHAIRAHNRGRESGLADGIVITPSHNPPRDGGIKYNPPSGGPAGTDITRRIEARANEILATDVSNVRRIPFPRALRSGAVTQADRNRAYVRELGDVVDLEVVANANLTLGVHPLGGAGVSLWNPIAETYGLRLEIVDGRVDPSFAFMTVDKDGKIRMDCSSPHAMAALVELRERYDLAFGNDGDADRFGIVTRGAGLMPPNHVLAAGASYLFSSRQSWPASVGVGKTLVSSSMIDRVARHAHRSLYEVPVGFKWFVKGLLSGELGFSGEESAGATFLRRNGNVWTTDKDGIVVNLLAAELMARTGKDPAEYYRDLEMRFGEAVFERIDAPASPEQKATLAALAPDSVTASELAGEPITAKLTRAPGNDAPIGGLKVVTENGWFAARPSGTEDVYKVYAESFRGCDHLRRLQSEAQQIVNDALAAAR
jgi:phosphoglucomutase